MTTEQFTLPKGVRRHTRGIGYEAYVCVGGKTRWRYFPDGTRVSEMVKWRNTTRERGKAALALACYPMNCVDVPQREHGIGFVYFIQLGPHIKIGKSNNLPQRLEELQTAHAEELRLVAYIRTPISSRVEAELRREFSHLRVRGEWFKLDGELCDLIRRHAHKNVGSGLGTQP